MNLGSFVIADPNKCTGCRSCEIACFKAHNKKNNVGFTVGSCEIPVIPRLYLVKQHKYFMPVQCRHCEDAPCLHSCPEKAIDRIDGVIKVNENKCIGCKTCMIACPIGAIELLPQYKNSTEVKQMELDEIRKTAYKCDFCIDNEKVACVSACPNNALRIIIPSDDKKDKNEKAALGLLNLSLGK